jgi:hypothetical protein
VEVTRLIDGKDLSTDETRQILLIIQVSFEAPLQIKVESDRQPRAASLLVERLERMPASSELTEDFVGTKKLLRRLLKVKAREQCCLRSAVRYHLVPTSYAAKRPPKKIPNGVLG